MKIGNDWDIILADELKEKYFLEIMNYLSGARHNHNIFPTQENIFKALLLTPYSEVRVVIIGQDPYHGDGQADGLAFSVPDHVPLPPSLRNIFKELNRDLNIPISPNGDLSRWAAQGVLLLNSVLTVEKGLPGSHRDIGWQRFTDAIIQKLNSKEKPIIFLLLGSYAQSKEHLISKKHIIIKTTHPSPFSAYKGFIGSSVFSQINNILKSDQINW